eukprot:441675-Pelagomonas_calceolata.AAC.1
MSQSALLRFKSALESAYKAHTKYIQSAYKARSVPKAHFVRARLFGARKRALQTESAQVQVKTAVQHLANFQ